MSDPSQEPMVIASGGAHAMREICDELRRAGLDAALVPPPDGQGGG